MFCTFLCFYYLDYILQINVFLTVYMSVYVVGVITLKLKGKRYVFHLTLIYCWLPF